MADVFNTIMIGTAGLILFGLAALAITWLACVIVVNLSEIPAMLSDLIKVVLVFAVMGGALWAVGHGIIWLTQIDPSDPFHTTRKLEYVP